MATQQANQQSQAVQTIQDESPEALLEKVLANTTQTAKYRIVDNALQERIDKVEELLPDTMKGQGHRLVKRAMLTFSRNAKLQECTPASFILCVLQAAELGFAIDGRLAHAVPYSNKYKDANGVERWRMEAQFQADYKGIIAVARRTRIVQDAYARLVYSNDKFRIWEEDAECHLFHEQAFTNRGVLLGAYAKVILPSGDWRYEWMDVADLDAIRARSKSFQAGYGPWKTDDGEMRKKTVLKRALKTYADDPAIIRLLESDDEDYQATEPVETVEPPPRHGRLNLRKPNGKKPEPVQPQNQTFADEPTETPEAELHEATGESKAKAEKPSAPAQPKARAASMKKFFLDRIADANSATLETVRQDAMNRGEILGDEYLDDVLLAIDQRAKEMGWHNPLATGWDF